MKKPPRLDVNFLVNNNEQDDTGEKEIDETPTLEKEIPVESKNTQLKPTFPEITMTDEKSKITKQSKTTKKSNLKYNLQYDVEIFNKDKKEKGKEKQEQEYNTGKWTEEEHQNFLRGFQALGRRWTKISKHFVKTRSSIQVTSYAQKYCRDNNIEFK